MRNTQIQCLKGWWTALKVESVEFTGSHALRQQKNLLMRVLEKKRFLVVVLDACRPDSFKRWIAENKPSLLKNVINVKSEGMRTPPWFIRTFSGHHFNATYVSANPYVNSAGMTPSGKVAVRSFTRIVDAWKEWDDKENTCMPHTVNKAVSFHFHEPRIIVHYLQPHQPYVGEKRIPERMYYKSSWNGYPKDPANPKILQVRDSRKLDEKEKIVVRQAYESNVDIVCSHAFRLINKRQKGAVVITSDHSEMMGEDGTWFHNISHPKLPIVPWLEMEK